MFNNQLIKIPENWTVGSHEPVTGVSRIPPRAGPAEWWPTTGGLPAGVTQPTTHLRDEIAGFQRGSGTHPRSHSKSVPRPDMQRSPAVVGERPCSHPAALSKVFPRLLSAQQCLCQGQTVWTYWKFILFIYFLSTFYYASTVVPFFSSPLFPSALYLLSLQHSPLPLVPVHGSCVHRRSLASPFPVLFLPSPCLFSTYHLCFLFPIPFPLF